MATIEAIEKYKTQKLIDSALFINGHENGGMLLWVLLNDRSKEQILESAIRYNIPMVKLAAEGHYHPNWNRLKSRIYDQGLIEGGGN
jgi:hypothetical protein